MDGSINNDVISLSSGAVASNTSSNLELAAGSRTWRIRVIPDVESDLDQLVIEVLKDTAWIAVYSFALPLTI